MILPMLAYTLNHIFKELVSNAMNLILTPNVVWRQSMLSYIVHHSSFIAITDLCKKTKLILDILTPFKKSINFHCVNGDFNGFEDIVDIFVFFRLYFMFLLLIDMYSRNF